MAKLYCKRGKYYQFGIDPLTNEKLTYSMHCTQHLTGLEVTTSGIVRAALALYVQKLEGLLELPLDDMKIYQLKASIKTASEGAVSPWECFPRYDTNKGPYPTFSALIANSTLGKQKPFDFLKYPLKPRPKR